MHTKVKENTLFLPPVGDSIMGLRCAAAVPHSTSRDVSVIGVNALQTLGSSPFLLPLPVPSPSLSLSPLFPTSFPPLTQLEGLGSAVSSIAGPGGARPPNVFWWI